MRIVRVTDEADVSEVAKGLLPARVAAKVRDGAVSAIRAANPGVDLDKLTPGMMLFVPDLDRAAAGGGNDVATDAVSSLAGLLGDAMTELRGLAESQQADSAERVGRLTEALDDPAVQESARANPAIAHAIEALRANLTSQPDQDAAAAKFVTEVADQWTQQFQFLAGNAPGRQ